MATPRVIGIDRVNKAFERAGRTLAEQKTPILKHAAEPVRRDAETLAVATITNITHPWSRMRIGVTKSAVYVAPKKRSTRLFGLRRPNLADLLRHQAMEPALERNRQQITAELHELLTAIARAF